MNRREFKELLNWLNNRPEYARQLADVLGLSMKSEGPEWVSAQKAGDAINMSSRWVRDHLDLFPSARKVEHGGRSKWMLDLNEVKMVWRNQFEKI